MAQPPGSGTELKEKRLRKILKGLKGKVITIVIDETGDRKKGKRLTM
jgi:SRSO17 transposase